MIRSMRPVVLKLASSRWPLPLITLAIALFLRAADTGRVDWRASDMQSMAAAILYGALIPVLVIALAASWLRGDDGPWAWALARPVTRARWLCTTLLIDMVTVLACIGLTRAVIGSLPHHWIQAWDEVVRPWSYAALIIAVYAAAAFGGARGTSAIGGALCVVAFAAFTMVLSACAAVSEETAREVTLEHEFYWFGGWRQLRVVTDSFGGLPSLSSMTIIAGIAIIAILRTARELPQRPRLASLAGLATIAMSIAITAPWVFITVVRWSLA